MAARPFYFLPQSQMGTVHRDISSSGGKPSAYTAGPWDTHDYGDKKYPTIKIEDDHGDPIAYIDRSDRGNAVSAANACLIAHAPELLALAHKLVIICDDQLSALTNTRDHMGDSLNDGANEDLATSISHYASLKYEAESCITEIE